MLSRDWQCLNRSCRQVFHSYDRGNPDCPHCGCARVSWIPGGGHIATVSGQVDRQLKSLAENYKMGNLNSPSESRLNRAMPKHYVPPPDGPTLDLGSGISAPVNMQGHPTAGWVDHKIAADSRPVVYRAASSKNPRITAGTSYAKEAILRGGKQPARA